MDFIGEIFICIIVVYLMVRQARHVIKIKKDIKRRANREFESDCQPTIEELESRLGESEVMYENLESSYWAHISVLVGIVSYLYWYVWYISLPIAVLLWVVGVKFLSVKPFTASVPD